MDTNLWTSPYNFWYYRVPQASVLFLKAMLFYNLQALVLSGPTAMYYRDPQALASLSSPLGAGSRKYESMAAMLVVLFTQTYKTGYFT